jgi:hypothetical protein
MNLYIVVRWGNDGSADKANGEDTIFLVRAVNHASAATLAEGQLERLSTHVQPFANVVQEIGIESINSDEPLVLIGPAYEFFSKGNLGYGSWIRDDPQDDWKTPQGYGGH